MLYHCEECGEVFEGDACGECGGICCPGCGSYDYRVGVKTTRDYCAEVDVGRVLRVERGKKQD